MKITILGLGSIGKRHLNTLLRLKKKFKINELSLFDTNPKRVNELKNKDKIIRIYNNFEKAIYNSKAIYVCTPTSIHIKICEKINSYGKFNIFIEKPLSHTLVGCEKLIEIQKENKKKVSVGYMLRYNPVLKEIKNILSKKTIGKLLTIKAESGFYLPFWHPWEDYRDFYMSSKLGGGGVVLDTSHEIDYMVWLAGNILDVQGNYGTISNLEISSDDYASALFTFENNVRGELHLDLLQPIPSRNVKLIGTKGVIIGDLINKSLKFNTIKNKKWKNINFNFDIDDIYKEESINVLNNFSGKKSITTSIEESYHVMQVIEGIRRSHHYGTRVRLPFYD